MDAIVTAGGIPQPEDPLYPFTNGGSKAMLDVAGRPMIQWVLDALSNTKKVDRVVIVGLPPKNELTCKKPLYYIPNQGRMLANIVAAVNKVMDLNKKAQYILIVSSDIPAIKGDMVDWLINTATKTKDELYYGVCPRPLMERRFPASNRTYTKLKDMEVCGSDINVFHVRMATEHLDTWEQLIGSRKSPFRQAALIGLDTFFKFATRQFTLQGLAERASQRIGIKGRAYVWPWAEPCMDVDKPHQLEIIRADLARQQRKAKAVKKTAPKRKITKPVPAKKAAKAKPKTKAKTRRK